MFDLQTDEKFPHHYIIGVAMRDLRSKNPGERWLKYGPVYFTNKDVENIADALTLLDDKIYTKIYTMKPGQIYETMECNELIMALIGMRLAAQANSATVHHFSLEYSIDDAEEFFVGYVARANDPNSRERKGLSDSLIRGF